MPALRDRARVSTGVAVAGTRSSEVTRKRRKVVGAGCVYSRVTIPDADARFQADVARLQAAKGIQVRAWLRENKTLAIVFAVYLATIAVIAGVFIAKGESPGGAILAGVFVGPLVMLRLYIRFRR